VVREPIGVAGCITPWNLPLIIVMQKLPAALIAGCTVILKPSEITPLHMTEVVDAASSAGIPPGVLNLVFGDGPEVGAAIAAHPDVDIVSFTGSTRAGRSVGAAGAETVKRVHLELGGKSANLILDRLGTLGESAPRRLDDLSRPGSLGQSGTDANLGGTHDDVPHDGVPRRVAPHVGEQRIEQRAQPAHSGPPIGMLGMVTPVSMVRANGVTVIGVRGMTVCGTSSALPS
jgi:hypothetical protein